MDFQMQRTGTTTATAAAGATAPAWCNERIQYSDDDGHCDSNSANDADVDDDNDDGGKQQRRQMPQQHSSTATYAANERNVSSCHLNIVDANDQSHENSETNWVSGNPLLSWVKARFI